MEKIISSEEAEKIIEPYYDKIVTAMSLAFDDYMKFKQGNSSLPYFDLNKRTIASLIHDFTRARIKETFHEVDDVNVGDFNKIFGLVIKNQVFIRFKKLKPDYSTSNIPTKQTRDYEDQLIEFPDFPSKMVFLYSVYMLNDTWTSIKNLYIIHKQGKEIDWIKDISGTVEQSTLSFIDVPIIRESELITRVKPKELNQNVVNLD